MSQAGVQQLLKENQALLLRERRRANRVPFVRPVVIRPSRGTEEYHAFSRDISPQGIGLISPVAWEPPAIVTLEIQSLNGHDVTIKAESRWCDEHGEGWYLIGFVFR